MDGGAKGQETEKKERRGGRGEKGEGKGGMGGLKKKEVTIAGGVLTNTRPLRSPRLLKKIASELGLEQDII